MDIDIDTEIYIASFVSDFELLSSPVTSAFVDEFASSALEFEVNVYRYGSGIIYPAAPSSQDFQGSPTLQAESANHVSWVSSSSPHALLPEPQPLDTHYPLHGVPLLAPVPAKPCPHLLLNLPREPFLSGDTDAIYPTSYANDFPTALLCQEIAREIEQVSFVSTLKPVRVEFTQEVELEVMVADMALVREAQEALKRAYGWPEFPPIEAIPEGNYAHHWDVLPHII